MNEKEILKNEAWKVDDLLDEYIKIHNRILEDAASFNSLFRKVDFEVLHKDSYEVFLKFSSISEHLNNLRNEINNQLSIDQQGYLNLLIEYVKFLMNTTNILSDNQYRMLEAAKNRKSRKLMWKEFVENQKRYNESIQEYIKIGEKLNKMNYMFFD